MNKKNLMFSILAVLLLGLIISSSTFAYFQWTTAENQRTAVNVSIEQGRITMHIEPEETTVTGLTPTADCSVGGAVLYTTVTVVNNTGTLAIPSFKLSARVTKGGSGTLTSEALSHINYLVYTNDYYNLSECGMLAPDVIQVGDTEIYSDGTFENVSTSGEWTDIPNESDTYLPRLYDKSTGNHQGTTFKAEPYSTTTEEITVFVWIDQNYTATNVGDTVNDPLNDAIIELTWSANSKIEQVTDSLIDPGLYSNDTFTSWDTLVSNGDITVVDNVITASSDTLSGGLVIPNSVTSIGDSAFAENSLTSVVIPDSVTSIGDSAFVGSSLTSVVIPDSVTMIGERAFYNSNLTNITIPDSVTTIGTEAFAENSLTSVVIPDSVTSIGNYVFAWNSLASVEIPDSVTMIGGSAFAGNSLTSVVIPDSVTSIGDYAFDQNPITDVYYKGTEEDWNAISIGTGNEELTNATIHYNYKEPGLYSTDGGFTSWNTLVSNGDITVTNNVITASNTDLSGELVISDSVTYIGTEAFNGALLTSVIIPDSVTYIDTAAFYGNPLTSVVIPKSVEQIFEGAFDNTQLTDVYYTGTEDEWNFIGIGEGNDPLTNATIHYNYTG